MNSTTIVSAVKGRIKDIYKAYNLSLHNPKTMTTWARFFDIKTVPMEEKVSWVLWQRPSAMDKTKHLWFKQEQPHISAAGGILGNSIASLVLAYL